MLAVLNGLLLTTYQATDVRKTLTWVTSKNSSYGAMLRVERFQAQSRTLEAKPRVPHGAPMTFIDGAFAWGTAGGPPLEVLSTQISAITVQFDKVRVELPKKWFSDLFNLYPMNLALPDSHWIRTSQNRRVIKFWFSGSDGTASYRVLFTVWKDGTVKREVNYSD